MNTSNPHLVSVVMTAYNAARYVVEAVESVLAQTYTHFELICVNDGSLDDTGSLLRSYGDRITLIEHATNGGIGKGRNSGLAVARGTYIAFIDADDIWEPEKMAQQLQFLHKNPALDMVFGRMQFFLSPELNAEERVRYECPPEPVSAVVPSAVFMHRNVFDRVGLFDPQWRVGEFVDWMARAQEKGVLYEILPKVVFMRRIHTTNTGITDRSSRVDYVRIARAALQRKRTNS